MTGTISVARDAMLGDQVEEAVGSEGLHHVERSA